MTPESDHKGHWGVSELHVMMRDSSSNNRVYISQGFDGVEQPHHQLRNNVAIGNFCEKDNALFREGEVVQHDKRRDELLLLLGFRPLDQAPAQPRLLQVLLRSSHLPGF